MSHPLFVTVGNHSFKQPLNLQYKRTLLGNEIGNHSDVVGAPPVDATPTTSSFST